MVSPFDGTSIWIANYTNNAITKLRACDGLFQATFTVPNTPARIAFDGANIWVTNVTGASVSKL